MAADFTWTEVADGDVVQATDVNQGKAVTDKLNNKELDNANIETDWCPLSVTVRFYYQAAAETTSTRIVRFPNAAPYNQMKWRTFAWRRGPANPRDVLCALYTQAGVLVGALAPGSITIPLSATDTAGAPLGGTGVSVVPGTNEIRVTYSVNGAGTFGVDEYCEVDLHFSAPLIAEP